MLKQIPLIAASLILLSACAAQSSKPSTDITVGMTDFAYSSPAITIPAGRPVTLTVKNEGQVEHDFVVETIDVTTKIIQDNGSNAHHAHGSEQVYDLHISARPGEASIIEFTAWETGTYKVLCTVEGHEEAGMIGELTVLSQE
jgi:uncharacterized cupredoxin-like copper-binding protein